MKHWVYAATCVAGVLACACGSDGAHRTNTGGAAGMAGSSGAGTGGGGSSGTGGGAPSAQLIAIDGTGFMQDDTLGLKGAWYAYGDAIGADGMAASSDCIMAGHAASECSSITTPQFGTFDNADGAMHTAGTVEKILDVPATTANPDYSHMWGAGIGCDLNNPGNADGGTAMKNPYDAPAHHVVGVSFDFDTPDHTVPLTGIRVEFPTPATATTAHIWHPAEASGNFVSPIAIGANSILFASDVAQPSFVSTPVAFDSSQVLSIQFHVPTTTSAGAPYDFTISKFALLIE